MLIANFRVDILKRWKDDIFDFFLELFIGHSGFIKGMSFLFKHVHNDRTWPDINSFGISVIPQNFRGHEKVSATLTDGSGRSELKLGSKSKICNFKFVKFILVMYKNILWFDISVNDTERVNIVDGLENAAHNCGSFIISKWNVDVFPFFDKLPQRTHPNIFHLDKNNFLVLKKLVDFDNIGMVER